MELGNQAGALSGFIRSDFNVIDPKVTLTILMPCLNEARTIATCIAKARGYLSTQGIPGEIVVADNGSTDGSREIAGHWERESYP